MDWFQSIFVVGLDINKNNLINKKKGAVKRILDMKNTKDHPLLDNTILIWADCSKNIAQSDAGIDSLNKFYIDVLWGNVINRKHIERLSSNKIKRLRGICREKFDIISSQFSLHYFFKNLGTLQEFFLNVSENLKVGGSFIATCFDGRKVFNMLNNVSYVERKDSKGKLLWRIDKKYNHNSLPKTDKCLGMAIDAYVETFSNSFEEYLINIDYLRDFVEGYGLEISSIRPFEEYYKELDNSGDLPRRLDDEQKAFSFLNVTLVISKKRDMTEVQTGGSKKNIDIFIANRNKLRRRY